jgi:hypothetical protein
MKPYKVSFTGLSVPSIEKVVRVALEMQYFMGAKEDYAAAEIFEYVELDENEKVALWSCFSSDQRSILKSVMQS